MVWHKAFKFRIYPTKEQEVLIAKTIGCSRFVFNRFLDKWNSAFKETGKRLSYGTCSAELTQLKKEIEWLKEVDSISFKPPCGIWTIPSSGFSRSRTKPRALSRRRMPFSRTQRSRPTETSPSPETN